MIVLQYLGIYDIKISNITKLILAISCRYLLIVSCINKLLEYYSIWNDFWMDVFASV